MGAASRYLSRLIPFLLALAAPTFAAAAATMSADSGVRLAALPALQALPAALTPPPPPKPKPEGAPAAGAAVPEAPATVPVPEVAVQAEQAMQTLREAQHELASEDLIKTVGRQLPDLSVEIQTRANELAAQVADSPTLEAVRSFEPRVKELEDRAAAYTKELTRRAAQLDTNAAALARLIEAWEATHAAAKAAEAPRETVERAAEVARQARAVRTDVLARRGQILTLQSSAADLGSRIAELRTALRGATEQAAGRLFVRDSVPLWSAHLRTDSAGRLISEGNKSLARQREGFDAWWEQKRDWFALHLSLALALIGLVVMGGLRVQDWAREEPRLAPYAGVFDTPVAAGLLLAFVLGIPLYNEAPRVLWESLGALGAVATVVVLRRVVDRDLHVLLYAMLAVQLADRLRALIPPSTLLSRSLFALQGILGIAFLLWWLWRERWRRRAAAARDATIPAPAPRLRAGIGAAMRLALLVLVTVLVLNAVGLVRLADFASRGLLGSAWAAVVLYAAVRVADGLLAATLRFPPLTLLRSLRRHGVEIVQRASRAIRWIAIGVWTVYALQLLSLRDPVQQAVQRFFTTPWGIGSTQFTLWYALLFFATIFGAWVLARLVAFVLEEEVYPRLALPRGLPFAVSTVTRYVILAIGFVLAVAAMGIDMTRFAIVAGALSVGIGFGLQNVVNNFVSGLILLFERPIKVGDMVQIGDTPGRVQHIGIRASVIRTLYGAEIIVPNGKLVSERVTNWTLSNHFRRFEIPVAVPAKSDAARVMRLMLEVARAHPEVLARPAPEALFTKLGTDTLEFELRAWTEEAEHWARVRSDLVTEINATLAADPIDVDVR